VNFTHLHVHSDASKDGLRPVKQLVTAAKKNGSNALALTDHGTLANSISFTIACQEQNIKPILGVEGYINTEGVIGHITLLADGDRGFKSLVDLQNKAHAESTGTRAAFQFPDLLNHSDGLICLSGCMASPMNNLEYSDSLGLAMRLKNSFGSKFFMEVMTVGDDKAIWERPMRLSSELGIKLVQTNDAHFPYKNDADIHQILVKVRAGFSYNSAQLWLKSTREMQERNKKFELDLDEAMERSYKIARLIKPIQLKRDAKLPSIKMANETLMEFTMSRLHNFIEDHSHIDFEEYKNRAIYELGVIKTMNYSSYFIILDDVITYAKSIGTRVGPGRGSGAGSLVLFLLGITEIDPIEYGLSFERFLNPLREGMPDVDIDFDSQTREKVLEYAARKWNAIPIATYSRYSHKSAVRDLFSFFKLSREQENKASEQGIESDAFIKAIEEKPLLGRTYDAILGQIRHKGKHAGGVVITDHIVPLEQATGDTPLVAAWTEGSNNELSYAGIVKFDFLGLSALSVLRLLEEEFKMKPDKATIGHPAFSIFQDSDYVGIFQFSGSSGIQELTREISPNKFEDVVAICALYRPGALDAGTAKGYPKWIKSPRKIHPKIDDILEETYGVIVYQEQVMAIFARVTSGGLGEADQARRVIVKSKAGSKEWEEKISNLKIDFFTKGNENGFDEKTLELLWREMITHARYSFNKAHSVAYSQISWELAWWRFTQPVAFYTALLNVDTSETMTYVFSALLNNIKIEMPHVAKSTTTFTHDDETIFFPISVVKFLGTTGADAIVDARKDKPFSSLADFKSRLPGRSCNARVKRGLYALGAFKGIDGVVEDLGVKDYEKLPWWEAQQKYLGFVIPTPELAKRIIDAKAKGIRAGTISKKEKRNSRWGDYYVYKLAPEGSFWVRGIHEDLEVGQLVFCRTNKRSGKATKVKIINFDDIDKKKE